MYYTGLDPRTMQPVYVPKDPREKAMQRALMQYKDPKNYKLVHEALELAHREDLIGFGPQCLIRPRKGESAEQKSSQPEKKPPQKKASKQPPSMRRTRSRPANRRSRQNLPRPKSPRSSRMRPKCPHPQKRPSRKNPPRPPQMPKNRPTDARAKRLPSGTPDFSFPA